MRRFFLLLPILLFTAAAWAAVSWAASSWHVFRDPAGAFTVEVPAKPAATKTDVPSKDGKSLQMLEYVIDRGEVALLITVTEFPRVTDVERVLDAAVNGAENGAAKKPTESTISVDGLSGRNVGIVDKTGRHIDDHIFVVGTKLYQILTVLPPAPKPAMRAEARRFHASFHFTRK